MTVCVCIRAVAHLSFKKWNDKEGGFNFNAA